MATNQYFNQFNHPGEQNLYEDLVVESLRMYAHDVSYLPRTEVNTDTILNEPIISRFDQALGVEMYVANFDSFQGEGALLSKFGLEIREQMTLICSKRSFEQFIKTASARERPEEGDCVYIPLLSAVYQIKNAMPSENFLTFGNVNMYELTMELLEYSNEQFNTGMDEIDSKYPAFEDGEEAGYDLERYDEISQNEEMEDMSDIILDISELNAFGGDE